MGAGVGDVIGSNTLECVAEGLGHTIRCANGEAGCKEPLLRYHGVGAVELLVPCPACGRRTLIRSTNEGGLSVFLVPRIQRVKRGA